jgi:hypothetical protein
LNNVKFIDVITGEVLDKEPVPIDYEVEGSFLIRVVPELQLLEVRLDLPYELFEALANITYKWVGVERPPDRIIFRYYKTKVNVFLDAVDYDASFEVLDPRKKVAIPVREGRLSGLGYSVDKSESVRREIIMQAVKQEGDWLPVYRHLIARATQLKRSSPSASKIMRSDAKWLKERYKGGD